MIVMRCNRAQQDYTPPPFKTMHRTRKNTEEVRKKNLAITTQYRPVAPTRVPGTALGRRSLRQKVVAPRIVSAMAVAMCLSLVEGTNVSGARADGVGADGECVIRGPSPSTATPATGGGSVMVGATETVGRSAAVTATETEDSRRLGDGNGDGNGRRLGNGNGRRKRQRQR